MRIIVDNEPVAVKTTDQSLGTIIDTVQAMISKRKRVVQRVMINGQPLADQLLARPVEQFERVEFLTACPRGLARQMLSAVASMFQDTLRLQREAAEKLSAGQMPKAMEMLLGCLNHYRVAQEAIVKALAANRLNLDEVKVDGRPAGQVFKSLALKLAEVKAALEARDFALLGDLLSYELAGVTEQWQAIVAELDRILTD